MDFVTTEAAAWGNRNGSRHWSLWLQQQGCQPGHFYHLPHHRRGVGYSQRAVNVFQLSEEVHDYANSGGTDVGHLGEIQTNAVRAVADHPVERLLEVIGPGAVQPPHNSDVGRLAGLSRTHFHRATR